MIFVRIGKKYLTELQSPDKKQFKIKINKPDIIVLFCVSVFLAAAFLLADCKIVERFQFLTVSLILLISGLYDMKNKVIPYVFCTALIITGIIFYIFEGSNMTPGIITAFASFVILAVLSRITRGAIGMGDAMLIAALGFCIAFVDLIQVIFFASLLTSILGLIQVLAKNKPVKSELPFVPFLWIAYTFLETGRLVLHIL